MFESWPVFVFVCLCASAFRLTQQATDPANQGLDEGVAGADLAVQTLHLQQLPLQSLSETCGHVTLQLHSHKHKTERSGMMNVATHICCYSSIPSVTVSCSCQRVELVASLQPFLPGRGLAG